MNPLLKCCVTAAALYLASHAYAGNTGDADRADRWENLSVTPSDESILLLRLDKDTILRRANGADVWVQHVLVRLAEGSQLAGSRVHEMAMFREQIDCKNRLYRTVQQTLAGRSVPILPEQVEYRSPTPGSLPEEVILGVCQYLRKGTNK